MAMRGALLAAAVLLRGCRGQQTTVLTVGGLFPTSQGDATNEDFNDDRRQAEAALAAINAVNADASVLPGVQLAFLAQDIAALRTLNSNSENFFQRQMAEEVAGDIAAVFRQADAVGVVGAGWSSDVKVLAPALGSLPLVSHSASASVLSNATLCKIVILSRFAVLPVSLTRKVSLFQGAGVVRVRQRKSRIDVAADVARGRRD